MNEPLIEISNAACRIGRNKMLKVSNLQMFPSQRWCFFGGNGSGKTLLANLLAGRRVESGSYVRYAKGFNPSRDIHWVSFEEQQRLWAQDTKLDMSEYSADAMDAGTTVGSLISSSRKKEVEDLELKNFIVTELGLSQLIASGIRFLSSGQIRKALLARALYAKNGDIPQLIILDDPLETVDNESKSRITRCIESSLHASSVLVQLCRRKADVFSWNSHGALIEDLSLKATGQCSVDELLKITKSSHAEPLEKPSLPMDLLEKTQLDSSVPLVELEGVSASYGPHQVFENLTWKMEVGDHVLIQGPNGCGKSTLLSLINGENHKAYGQKVRLFGKSRGSGETIWEVKSLFGLVSNELHNKYVKGWKVLDVVVSGFFDSVGLYANGEAIHQEKAGVWLSSFGLSSIAHQNYGELSFGQQRLILLARAMIKSPRILIMDEPCVGLDDFYRNAILDLVNLIAAKTTTQLIYVSHVVDERPICLTKCLSFERQPNGDFKVQPSLIESRD